jgi:hypothetical protein
MMVEAGNFQTDRVSSNINRGERWHRDDGLNVFGGHQTTWTILHPLFGEQALRYF